MCTVVHGMNTRVAFSLRRLSPQHMHTALVSHRCRKKSHHHEHGGWKQHIFILLPFHRPGVPTGSCWAKIKVSLGLHAFLPEAQGRVHFLIFSSS